MTNKFFVYGTLKVGGIFSVGFTDEVKKINTAVLEGFDLFGIGAKNAAYFPGIVPGTGTVYGEIHEYDEESVDSVLARMDRIEGFSEDYPERSLYRREVLKVLDETGKEVEAFVYIFNQKIQDNYSKIEKGVWKI